MVSVNRSIFIGDSLYQKLLILVQLCWRYLKISQMSGFLRHSVDFLAERIKSSLFSLDMLLTTVMCKFIVFLVGIYSVYYFIY